MRKTQSESIFKKIIIGVAITVISTMIITHLGLEDGGSAPVYHSPNTQPTYPQSHVQTGNWCCDAWGNKRCQLATPLAIGSPCYCPGQGSGVVCK